MRVAMARVLLGRPDVLLMDEPTNHLDIESIIWLEAFLKSQPGALLMTSHDREFMNRFVTKIAEIDGGEITVYSGNYDFYERERATREANREAAYARQQAMLAKEQRFIERFSAHAAKAAQVQSRVKALEKIEKVELPKKRKVVQFKFRQPPRHPKWRDVNLAATVPGWQRWSVATEMLARLNQHRPATNAAASPQATAQDFAAFLAANGGDKMSIQQRDALFRQFVEWQQHHAPPHH